MKKTYILDTNVLLTDANALFSFEESNVILPFTVLEELDRHKDRQDEVGRNARETARKLGALVKSEKEQDLAKGMSLGDHKGLLKILSIEEAGKDKLDFPSELEEFNTGDNRIIKFCLSYAKKHTKENIILVTRDILLQIKGAALGIEIQDYKKFNVAAKSESLYSGCKVIEDFDVQSFYTNTKAGVGVYLTEEQMVDICPNEFLILKNGNDSVLARFLGPDQPLKHVESKGIGKFNAKNKEQVFALDLLMDTNVKLVTLIGKAGSGKTLCALAAGLEQVIGNGGKGSKNRYKTLVVTRPIQPMGKDVGFLPGPQPLDAKVLTPTGWTTMGKLQPGMEIVTRTGKASKIIGVYPKGVKPVYKITTSDKTTTECCADHLWFTKTFEDQKRKKSGSVKSTQQIMDSLLRQNGKPNHYLPRNEQIHFAQENKLPIPAYTLGVILGDGLIGDSISIANKDEELLARVKEEVMTLGCTLVQMGTSIVYNIRGNCSSNKPSKKVKITNINTGVSEIFNGVREAGDALGINQTTINSRCFGKNVINDCSFEFIEDGNNRWSNPVKNTLFDLGLENKRAFDKFIPSAYRYSSIENRVALLQGLMDTDGTIKKSGEASFCTVSKQLALDVIEIVQSLGGRAVLRQRKAKKTESIINGRKIKSNFEPYEFTISLPNETNPFFVKRKASRHFSKHIEHVKIESIELSGEKETQCILIEDPEHLYVTDGFIVTHNTLQEKMEPWIAPIKDNLRFLITEGKKGSFNDQILNEYFENGIIEVEAMTFIRGRSIADAIIIVDEAQNLTVHELKTILTRVGENTKIILTGDVEQIDNMYLDSVSNGLSVAIERFKTQPIAGHITLVKGERSELATIAANCL